MRESSGKRSSTESTSGRYVGYRKPKEKPKTIAFDATLRAAAPHQHIRTGKLVLHIEPSDIREKILERKTGNSLLFVVDASGSMGVQQRMSAVKATVLSLLIDAYQKRDKVGLVVFRGDSAELLVPLTSSVNLAETKMRTIPTGGKTPLGHGLVVGFETLMREKIQNPGTKPIMIILSDGKINVSTSDEEPMEDLQKIAEGIMAANLPAVVIDSEKGLVKLGFAQKLAKMLGAKYLKSEELELFCRTN